MGKRDLLEGVWEHTFKNTSYILWWNIKISMIYQNPEIWTCELLMEVMFDFTCYMYFSTLKCKFICKVAAMFEISIDIFTFKSKCTYDSLLKLLLPKKSRFHFAQIRKHKCFLKMFKNWSHYQFILLRHFLIYHFSSFKFHEIFVDIEAYI